MKVLQEIEDAKMSRKLLKPQVEKRRRERMNRSLETLRGLLLQGQEQQGRTQRRVEKAEILEHTVLFLHNTADRDRKNGEVEGQQQHSYDGFSACLRRATQFLGPRGESLRLGATLEANFAARLACSESVGVKAAAKSRYSNSVPRPESSQSIPQMMMVKSIQAVQALGSKSMALAKRVQLQDESARQTQKPDHTDVRVQRQATTESQSQNLPASQSLWRPWP